MKYGGTVAYILYCFIWAKKYASIHHGGYGKYMLSMWKKIRPDRQISVTALQTKGKRLYKKAMHFEG